VAERKAPAGGIVRTCLDVTWQTPPEIIDAVRAYFGGRIPLDPATAPDNPTGAVRFCARPQAPIDRGPSLFGERDQGGELVSTDGLSIPWDAGVWLNPPFGKALRSWLLKVEHEAARGTVIIALLPCARWEQGYMHTLLSAACAAMFFRGRIAFISTLDGERVGGNPYASMLLGFNVDLERFRSAFLALGACFEFRALGGS
jgi:hypothetical protein